MHDHLLLRSAHATLRERHAAAERDALARSTARRRPFAALWTGLHRLGHGLRSGRTAKRARPLRADARCEACA